MATIDQLQERVRAELPEAGEIADAALREKVIEAWATALADSSFESIAEIRPSGNPDTPPLKKGTQTDHIRGVTRLAIRMADELAAMFPDLKVNRDILIAGAICHDVGKPWEFDPENQARWKRAPGAAGWPSITASGLRGTRVSERGIARRSGAYCRRTFGGRRTGGSQPRKYHR